MKYLPFESNFEFNETEELFIFFKLLSSNVFEDMSLFGLNLPDLPSSARSPKGLIEGTAPESEEGGIKLFCIENPGLLVFIFSPEDDDGCKCEELGCIDKGCPWPCKRLL